MKRIAVIGSGIAGLGCAYFLDRDFEVTVYEKDSHIGGHSNTILVQEEEKRLSVDTGFMVYNRVTYPNLTRLFQDLDVKSRPTSMSFSVQHVPSGLEYCGSSFNHLFAQRKNLFNFRFIRMLFQIGRFNREAFQTLNNPEYAKTTLQKYIEEKRYGDDFARLYLIPMSSAVWSSPPRQMKEFPALSLLRFFHNHGFLGMYTQHPWLTVEGGSKSYVEKLTAKLKLAVRTNCAIREIDRKENEVILTLSDGSKAPYDRVILATHADQALMLLKNPTDRERGLLSRFEYQTNRAVLHTDSSLMPRAKLAWASWNYRIENDDSPDMESSTTYWMNNLQGLQGRKNYFVSINPGHIAENDVIQTIPYEHPLFNLPAIDAQKELSTLNQMPGTRTYFCGSYFKYGFHEDAFTSALNLSEMILRRSPWR